jgi:aryl-alcohol dehydrogenase-like predicted oxidoreductase
MKLRQLGQGLVVSELGLGCMGMSQAYGPPDEAESLRTIDRALELGITFLDTANAYGWGANEELLGRAIRGRRPGVVIATKFGLVRGSDGRGVSIDARPDAVRAACDASLQRLQMDAIDLYYLHRVDPRTPIEDTVGAMADLVRAGKVRCLGLSEVSPSTIRRAHGVHPIAAVQSEYSLWFRDPERAVLPLCRELGIGFVPFSPLGRGFLSGRVVGTDDLATDDLRRRLPRFQGDNLRHNRALVQNLERLAESRGCAPSQLALAWLLARGEDLVPIPGTKRRTYLESNAAAAGIQLGAEDVAQMDALFPHDAAVGPRYADDMMRLLDVEDTTS